MKYLFRLTGAQHQQLKSHLHSGDGLEAVAIGLCGIAQAKSRTILILHKVQLIPYEKCDRTQKKVSWDGRIAREILEEAMKRNMTIVKFHSHPNGYNQFSETDDIADGELIESAYGWTDTPGYHSSLVMLPDGELFGRWYNKKVESSLFDSISVSGENILFFDSESDTELSDQDLRNRQVFGIGTTQLLKKLKVGIVGCSGTGSPIIENLARLGVGELIFVDHDRIEKTNLNRIINSTLEDAQNNRYKTKVLSTAIAKMGFQTNVETFEYNLYNSTAAIESLSTCDILFGCMDSVDGRHLLNKIASFYSIPYFDIGVKIEADGEGKINSINTAVHYLIPGQSLLKKGVYNEEELRASSLRRTNPKEYSTELKEGYIINADVSEPAVLPINMIAASSAVLEFLSRIHKIRSSISIEERSSLYHNILEDMTFLRAYNFSADPSFDKYIGRGNCEPLLMMSCFHKSTLQ